MLSSILSENPSYLAEETVLLFSSSNDEALSDRSRATTGIAAHYGRGFEARCCHGFQPLFTLAPFVKHDRMREKRGDPAGPCGNEAEIAP